MIQLISEKNYQSAAIGGKAKVLFELKKLGYPVPALHCLSAATIQTYLGESSLLKIKEQLQSVNEVDPKTAAEISTQVKTLVRERLKASDFGQHLAVALEKECQGELFSVRSSAGQEDGEDHSFAGQFETLLSVKREGLESSVIECICSQFSVNVLRYGQEKQLELSILSLSVIIQEMVVGNVSGVLFTANPQGLLSESVIVVGEGTGDKVVMDKVPTTTYYYHLRDQEYYFEQEAGPLIESKQLLALIELGQSLKKQYQKELDIEFTFSGNRLYLLQARGITTLTGEIGTILDNSNIVESYPGLTLPLSYSFIKQAYEGVFRGLALRSVGNQQLLEPYDGLFQEMVTSVNGRVYYKISNWYTLLSFLPLHNKIIPIWEEMLGIEESGSQKSEVKLSLLQRGKTYGNIIKEFLKTPAEMTKLNQEFSQVEILFAEKFHNKMSNQDVFALYAELKDKVLQNWDITLLNDLYAFIYTGWLKNAMKRKRIVDFEGITNQLISGMGNLESMKPMIALDHLVHLTIKQGQVQEIKDVQTETEAIAFLQQHNQLSKAIQAYIEEFGDRSLEELKLETETFRAKPLGLFKELQHYLTDPATIATLETRLATRVEPLIPESISHNRHLYKLSQKAILGIHNRETSRLNRSRLYGMVRSLFTQIGNNLKEEGLIDHARDVFYLEISELEKISTRDLGLKQLIAERQVAFEQFALLPAYSRLVYADNEFDKSVAKIGSGKIVDNHGDLSGTPCSAGIVEGEVLIVDDPKQLVDSQGKILVAKMTDPGWVFILARAKGIITEKGSLLSHTAIISRELQLPAIVGVKDVTQILRSGEWVTLNAVTGKITRRQTDVPSE